MENEVNFNEKYIALLITIPETSSRRILKEHIVLPVTHKNKVGKIYPNRLVIAVIL